MSLVDINSSIIAGGPSEHISMYLGEKSVWNDSGPRLWDFSLILYRIT